MASSCSSSRRRSRWRRSSCPSSGIIFVVALAALFGQALTRRFTGAESDGTIVISLACERQARRSRGDHCAAAQAASEGQARERFANRSRNRRVLQLPGYLGQRARRTAGRAECRRRSVHVQRLLQQTGRAVDALHTADPIVAAHRRDRGDLRGDADAGIRRPVSALAIRRSVEPRGAAKLACGSDRRDRERRTLCCRSRWTTPT